MPYTAGPFDSAHLYLQWGGKLPGGESWSNGIRFAKVGGGAVPDNAPEDLLLVISEDISTFHASSGAQIGAQAKLSYVKLNVIGTDGRYQAPGTYERVLADIAGGGATPVQPNQVALAVSLRTAFSRGPAHSGRVYLPVPAINVSATTGLVASENVQLVADAFDDLVGAIDAHAGASYKPSVFSRKSGSPAHHDITTCAVGRVLDTQRRRRRSLAELYALAA